MVLAREEALLLGHGFIGTRHVLLGLIGDEGGLASRILAGHEIRFDDVRGRITEAIGVPVDAPLAGASAPFTPRTKKVLELSLREALHRGDTLIDSTHLLLGLIREGEGVDVHILRASGLDVAGLRRDVLEAMADPTARRFGRPHA